MASTSKEASPKKPVKRLCTFQDSWLTQTDCIKRSRVSNTHAFCEPCRSDFSIGHGGQHDITKHLKSEKHRSNYRAANSSRSLTSFFSNVGDMDLDAKVIEAETLFTGFLVEHNLPLSVASHATQLFKRMFPDSKIAAKYQCGRTKATHILNSAVAKDSITRRINLLNSEDDNACQWWSLATDGSSDVDDKYFPFIIRHWDGSHVVPTFVDMSVCNQATAANIYAVLDECVGRYGLKWEKCSSYAGDNASVNKGLRNSIFSRIKEKQPNVYWAGCSCHLSNLAAQKGGSALRINVPDLLIDLYYHFDKSCKRKDELRDFQVFCGEQVRKVIKHVSTRWLSLSRCIERLLQMYDSLHGYFVTNFDKDGDEQEMGRPRSKRRRVTKKGAAETREDRIVKHLKNPITKAYALFLHAVLPAFDGFNLLLQREEPMIHVLYPTMMVLYEKLLGRLVRTDALAAHQGDILDFDFKNESLQRNAEDLFIGSMTRQHVRAQQLEGTSDLKNLYSDVRDFYTAVLR